MDLVERYLQAVRFWLPKANQDDLVAELADDLRSQREDAEERLGRPMDARETADLLKRTGHPLQVASRFLQQGPLLDPALSMIYRFVVKVVLVWILIPLHAVTALPGALLSAHPLANVAGALAAYAFSAIFALGCITLAFTLVQRAGPRPWDPLKLPALRAPGGLKPIPRFSSLVEVVFGLLFAGWWMEAFGRLPMAWSSPTGPLWSAGPLWRDFHGQWFLPMLVLALAGCACSAVSLARPHWVRFRLAWGTVSGALVAAMCLITYQGHRTAILANFAALRTLHGNAQDPANLGVILDAGVAMMLVIAALGNLGSALSQGYRLVRTGLRP
jgi:hypothetical protein